VAPVDKTETSWKQQFERHIVHPALSFVSRRSAHRARTSALLGRCFALDFKIAETKPTSPKQPKREENKQAKA
jgi:hypothetical protein